MSAHRVPLGAGDSHYMELDALEDDDSATDVSDDGDEELMGPEQVLEAMKRREQEEERPRVVQYDELKDLFGGAGCRTREPFSARAPRPHTIAQAKMPRQGRLQGHRKAQWTAMRRMRGPRRPKSSARRGRQCHRRTLAAAAGHARGKAPTLLVVTMTWRACRKRSGWSAFGRCGGAFGTAAPSSCPTRSTTRLWTARTSGQP